MLIYSMTTANRIFMGKISNELHPSLFWWLVCTYLRVELYTHTHAHTPNLNNSKICNDNNGVQHLSGALNAKAGRARKVQWKQNKEGMKKERKITKNKTRNKYEEIRNKPWIICINYWELR